MTINAAIFIFAVFVVFSNPEMTKEYWDTVTQTYEQMTGQDLDEVLEGYGLEMR